MMPLDRVITLGLVQPMLRAAPRGVTEGGGAVQTRLPILMYHSVSDDPEPGLADYFKVCVSPRRFADHLRWLAAAGWRGVSTSEGLQALGLAGYPRPCPPAGAQRLVALEFDDGFADFLTAAVPALRQHGFTATMNLPTGSIGDQRRSFKGRPCLTWNEVAALQEEGFEFGAHTVNHPRLASLPWAVAAREISESKVEIEQRLGRPVRTFACPYNYPQADPGFRQRYRTLLAELGFRSATTTIIGRARPVSERFELPRLPASQVDDEALLLAKLSGAYDWLAMPQRVFKHARHLLAPSRQ